MVDTAAFFSRYDAFGLRRAGSESDVASARWLADEAGSAGAQVRLAAVPFTRFLPGTARLVGAGLSIEGLPLFDGGLTGPAGVRGAIGPLGSDVPIGFADMSPGAASLPGNAFARARADSRHAAIVVALHTRAGGLAPLNAHDTDAPFGPPVLQIAGRDAPAVAALSRERVTVELVVDGSREPSQSLNVRAALDGSDPPLVLLTPRTSWWTSTAERGGGIHAWLEALGALAAARGSRAVVALATCGHELGHIGAHRAFADEPQLASTSHLVIHLGANLGTADDPALTVRSNVDGLAQRMAILLADAGYPAAAMTVATGGKAGGEAHEIEGRGGRYLSLIGSNPWFHAPEDRWPQSVDVARAAAIARAVSRFAVEHAGTAAVG